MSTQPACLGLSLSHRAEFRNNSSGSVVCLDTAVLLRGTVRLARGQGKGHCRCVTLLSRWITCGSPTREQPSSVNHLLAPADGRTDERGWKPGQKKGRLCNTSWAAKPISPLGQEGLTPAFGAQMGQSIHLVICSLNNYRMSTLEGS